MGFTLDIPPDSAIPKELRGWFKKLRAWMKDRERFEKSITSGAGFQSASRRLSLKQGVVVDSTRVASTEPGVTALDLTGDLIPSADNTYNIGSATYRYKDIRQSGTAYLTGVSVSGVLTGLSRANLSYGASVSGGLVVSGGASFTGGAFIGSPTGSTRTWTFTDAIQGLSAFQVLSDGNNVDLTIDMGDVTFGLGGFTSIGPADFLSPTSFAAGISAASGFTYTGPVATLKNLTVNDGTTVSSLTAAGNARIDGAIGVTGQAVFVGGVSANGGITFSGSVQLHRPGVIAGEGVTGNIIPLTTLTGGIGLASRRWGNVFGGTLTLTNSAVIGGTISANAQPANTNNTLGGSLTITGQLSVSGGFASETAPATDDMFPFGSPTLRWNSLWLSGIVSTAMGATITAGNTLTITGDGNYYHVSGKSDIYGISSADPVISGTAAYQPGVFLTFHLVNNPSFSNSSRIILNGGTTFSGATGNMITFVSEGADNWREVSRSA